MENALYITIETENMDSNISYKGSVSVEQYEEIFSLTDYHKFGIKITDKRIYTTENVTNFSSAVGELFRSILKEIQIIQKDNESIYVSINAMRMLHSEKELLWNGNIAPYINGVKLDGYYIGQELVDKLYSYVYQWQDCFSQNLESKNIRVENTEARNDSNIQFSTNKDKYAFFFCYILPVIIVSVILAPTIIGLLVFIIIMFRGKVEFVKGRKRCSDSDYSVDWDFTEYKYSVSGNVQSGLNDLDLFLLILKPVFNFFLIEIWKLIDFISAFILKIIFSISCLIYRSVTSNNSKKSQSNFI